MTRIDRDVERGLARMVELEPRLDIVADTIRDLAHDDTVSALVYDRVCVALFRVLDLWLEAQS